ncbi:MAG: AraC family transcriptional regulator [Bacteroidota bacterium]
MNRLELLSWGTYPFINIAQMLLPVLIFLYVKSIFYHEDSFVKKNIGHLIPIFIFFLFYTLPNLITHFVDVPALDYARRIDQRFITIFKDSFGLFYFIFSLRLFRKAQEELKHLYSNFKQSDFLWLNTFLLTFFGVFVIDFIFSLSEFLFQYNVVWDGYITVILILISMFYLAYYGIQQISIFIPEFLVQNQDQISNTSKQFLEIDEKLKEVLAAEKPYLIPNLTLKDLAEKVDTSEKVLSHFLNNFLNVSFYDLINSYRVNEAKAYLKSSDEVAKYSISGIGTLCGFSSKSSFYRVFKKETGFTPLGYKKQYEK